MSALTDVTGQVHGDRGAGDREERGPERCAAAPDLITYHNAVPPVPPVWTS
jgi:hypothetical protein